MLVTQVSLAVLQCGEAVPSVSSDVCAPGDVHGKDPARQCRRRRRGGSTGPGLQSRLSGEIGSLGQEDAPPEKWQPTPVFLPEKSHEQRSLADYSPGHLKEPATTEHAWSLISFRVLCFVLGFVVFSAHVSPLLG